jgi:hypothetical protein
VYRDGDEDIRTEISIYCGTEEGDIKYESGMSTGVFKFSITSNKACPRSSSAIPGLGVLGLIMIL